jgi:hypothetical protein
VLFWLAVEWGNEGAERDLVLLGLSAIGAASVGRQDAPANRPVAPSWSSAKPVAFYQVAQAPAPTTLPAPTSTGTPAPSAKIELTEKPVRPDNKRKVEGALTAAAIAAIIVQASRAISRKAVRLPG